jgi:hypothetical protein
MSFMENSVEWDFVLSNSSFPECWIFFHIEWGFPLLGRFNCGFCLRWMGFMENSVELYFILSNSSFPECWILFQVEWVFFPLRKI